MLNVGSVRTFNKVTRSVVLGCTSVPGSMRTIPGSGATGLGANASGMRLGGMPARNELLTAPNNAIPYRGVEDRITM